MTTNPNTDEPSPYRALNEPAVCPQCGRIYFADLCPTPECRPGYQPAATGALSRRLAEAQLSPPPHDWATGPAASPHDPPAALAQYPTPAQPQYPPTGLPQYPPSAPWGTGPPEMVPPPRLGRSRDLKAAGIVLLVIAVGAASWLGLNRLTSAGSSKPRPQAQPTFPATWDPRVAPLADFVERTRGLAFDHPVFIDFLTPAQYSASVHVPATTQSEKTGAQRQTGMYRAVGLISGDVDLSGAGNLLADQGTLAYYSHRTKRIDVRGTDLTPSLRVTLVHEMTHALQDQHFDLGRIDKMALSGEQTGFQTLFEGDAVRVQEAYAATLTGADKASYDADQSSKQTSGKADLSGVPSALVTLFGAPYDLGPELLKVLISKNSNDSVDEAFRNPPVDEAQVFDPWVYLAHQQPDKVSTPAVPAGGKSFDSGDFGALSWFVALSQRIDPHVALQAADAWAGDAFVAFQQNQRVCVLVDVHATSASAGARMASGFTQWARAMPAGAVTVTPKGTGLEVNACDPGPTANLTPVATAADAMVLPVVRTEITLSTLHQGGTLPQARCAGTAVVGAYSEAEPRGQRCSPRPGL